jgi:hypothetical protein
MKTFEVTIVLTTEHHPFDEYDAKRIINNILMDYDLPGIKIIEIEAEEVENDHVE